MKKYRKSRPQRLKQVAISLPVAVLVSTAYVHGQKYFELRHTRSQIAKALTYDDTHLTSTHEGELEIASSSTEEFRPYPLRNQQSKSYDQTEPLQSTTSHNTISNDNFPNHYEKENVEFDWEKETGGVSTSKTEIEIENLTVLQQLRSKYHRRKLADENDDNSFPDDIFSDSQLKYGAFLLHCVGMLYTFFALAIVCDEFFVPSLEVIVARLRIPEDVAGATFMAAGGSAPELWTSFIGLFVSKDEVGFGTIVGSAVFNILFVIGSCAFASSTLLTLTWWPLTRDVFFYAVSLIMLTYFFYDDKIYLYEGFAMFVLYCLYVVFMCYNEVAQIKVKAFIHRLRRKLGLPVDSENISEDEKHMSDENNHSNSEKLQIIDGKKNAKHRGDGKIVPVDRDVDIESPDRFQRSKSFGWEKLSKLDETANEKPVTQIEDGQERQDYHDYELLERKPSVERRSLPANFKVDFGRERGVSDPSDIASNPKGDGRYFPNESAMINNAKKPRPTDVNNLEFDRRTSTGMMRRLHVTRGAGQQEGNADQSFPQGVRRARRMSETSRMMFGLEGPSKGYKALFHEGGTIAARQMFQVSVMKTMITRSQSPGEKFLKTVKAAATVAKHERNSKIEYLNDSQGVEYGQIEMGGVVETISVKPKNDLHNDGETKIVSLESLHTVEAKSKEMDIEAADHYSRMSELGVRSEFLVSAEENGRGANDDHEDAEEEEKEANDALDLSFPDETLPRIIYLITAPITFSLYYTVPDVRRSNRENYFIVSFFMSILWIVVYTFCMVWWATVIGDTLNIPSVIMGLTILAAGTSVPDLLTSVIVATHGHGDMAVSSSIGSNLFDVCIGLPIPWIIYIIVYNKPVEVGTNLILISVAILFFMLVATISTIALNKWQMTKTMGVIMFLLYILFMVIMIVIDSFAD